MNNCMQAKVRMIFVIHLAVGLAACDENGDGDSDTGTDSSTDVAGDVDAVTDSTADGDVPADTPSEDVAPDLLPGTCVGADLWFDGFSGLCWQNTETIPMDGVADGITACEDLTLGGFEWELPTIDQLRSLIRWNTCSTDCGCSANVPGGACGVTDPGCLATTCNTECAGCYWGEGPETLYGCYFAPDMSGTCMGAPFWSRSIVSDDTAQTWQLDFSSADVLYRDATYTGYIRCVRIES